MLKKIFPVIFFIFFVPYSVCFAESGDRLVSTFSIVARDAETGELGIGVASRFFAVGSVVPWAKAEVGAVATQSYANTSFGWRGLELLEKGANPEEVIQILLRTDTQPERRQVGIVGADGKSATYTGKDCLAWAGGRNGTNYAIQGNILAGESVVVEMERVFLGTKGSLADRIYAALLAGEQEGGDSRGKQSAAILVVEEGAGYGGYTDRAIDIRVDDHPEPFQEIGRLLRYAQTYRAWIKAWTAFTNKDFETALLYQERAARISPENAEVLYDLACIKLAMGKKEEALEALKKSFGLNPKLKQQALKDKDLAGLHNHPEFKKLAKQK